MRWPKVSSWAGATPALAATAQPVSIYKDEKFSHHAPIAITYAI
jgi:exonuclease III